MNSFTLLWSKILDSSIWVTESKETRLVWITLLAMKDSNGHVHASLVGLADRAKVSVEECKAALQVFLSPDPNDTSGVEDGVRVRVIPGGWEIVNHDLYRFSTDAKREYWRQAKARERERKGQTKAKHNGAAFSKASAAGATDEQLDSIVNESLPEKCKTPQRIWEGDPE